VNLVLDRLPVLVVGAGKVALRKVRGLLAAGAEVSVVAPKVEPEFDELRKEGQIELFKRPYESGEATGYRLVFSATGDERVDWQVSYDAATASVFTNVADVPDRCNFYLPAVVKRGNLQIGINTDGVAPFVARRLRERLENIFGEEFTSWLTSAGAFREAVLSGVADPHTREALFDRFFNETWPTSDAPVTQPATPAETTWRDWIAEATGDATASESQGDG
jgi:precorrin-2 dehydrogenase/sirohydrochlorin ferrochelatase